MLVNACEAELRDEVVVLVVVAEEKVVDAEDVVVLVVVVVAVLDNKPCRRRIGRRCDLFRAHRLEI